MRCHITIRGNDVAPAKAVAECYRRHWHAELLARKGSLRCVVAVGTAASKFLLGEWAGERAAGSLVEIELPTP